MAPETKTSLTETQGSPAKLFVTLSLRLPNNTLKSQDFNVTLKKNTNGDATQTATEIPLASHSGSNGKLY